MKKNIALLGVFFILSCGHSSQVAQKTGEDKIVTEDLGGDIGEIDLNLLKSYMAFDVLGGVFRKNTAEADSMIVAKLSLNVPPPQPSSSELQSSPFNIDYSNQYSGAEGKGRLVISALGSGEEFFSPHSPDPVVRHFTALTLRFIFHNYAFNNECLGEMFLDGEVHCEIAGDYEMEKEQFLGEAHCVHGPKSNPATVLYITPQKIYELGLDAILHIDGNIYRYNSYKYDGKISIDGEEQSIEDIQPKGGSCS